MYVGQLILKNKVSNKLFATFIPLSEIDNLIFLIKEKYNVLYNKIFILHSMENDEYICTYNIECGNINDLIENTILVHRKKISNTLYSLNALNKLIMELNGGKVDRNFQIKWDNYKNSILLTQNGELKTLKTNIYKIVNLKS